MPFPQADTYNHVIRCIVISSGAVTTLAGTSGISGYVNGLGTTASFNSPRSVAIDAAGTIALVVSCMMTCLEKGG